MLDRREVKTGKAERVNSEESRAGGLCGLEGQVCGDSNARPALRGSGSQTQLYISITQGTC